MCLNNKAAIPLGIAASFLPPLPTPYLANYIRFEHSPDFGFFEMISF